MRNATCLECRTKVDICWRWCPECGSLDLAGPPADDFVVGWDLGVDWLGPDEQPLGSPA